ncbi:MAG TPA: hypothetical protein VIP70_01070 [Nitrososphaeraceae archaeon]
MRFESATVFEDGKPLDFEDVFGTVIIPCFNFLLREEKLRNNFQIPNELSPTVIVGFGYPVSNLTGKRKNRLPIHKLVYYEKYGKSKS